ncbi:jg15148 [Pararge aegeria aegeria]|uniref:Jg15148 protein n=1 Tax=Pararge aegeria aegeria TaxID=348720 RepID=A0A8S4S2Z4_9NEOP|nr:jg15148 [Pararge aegeria aegeria]
MYNIPDATAELYNFSTTVGDMFNSTMPELLNDTFSSVVLNATDALHPPHRSSLGMLRILLKVAYAVGIIGNAAAILALRIGERRVRNRKHLLLLTSLAVNDLVALQVTYCMICGALLVSWLWAAVLTCAPVLGVGLYYDAAQQACRRYREATHGLDFGYAVFYVMFASQYSCGIVRRARALAETAELARMWCRGAAGSAGMRRAKGALHG